MKLIGILEDERSLTYIPMSALTVTLGANDVGKTRILDGITNFLNELREPIDYFSPAGYHDDGSEILPSPSCAYFSLSKLEMTEMIEARRQHLLTADLDPDRVYVHAVDQPVLDSQALRDSLSSSDGLGTDGWLRTILRAASVEPDFDIEAIVEARIVGVSKVRSTAHRIVQSVWVCSPERDPGGWPKPVATVNFGVSNMTSFVPKPMRLPVEWDTVSSVLFHSLTESLKSIRLSDRGSPEWNRVRGSEADETKIAWLERNEDPFQQQVNECSHYLCELLSCAATTSLADFAREHYAIYVSPAPIDEWRVEPTLRIGVQRGENFFRLESIAEGHHLWLQLALLEAASLVDRVTPLLTQEVELLPEKLTPGQTENALLLRQMWVDYCSAPKDDRESTAREIVARAGQLPHLGRDSEAPLNQNLYVLDEPERHLHPGLQRRVAKWFEEWIATRDATALIATHSPAFLSMGGGATYNYVWRDDDQSRLAQIEPGEMHAFDQISEELGFNRGELLSSIRLMLFVEGRADQIVIERLYGRELREHGIEVVPVHGVFKFSGVIEAETLWKYTSAEIAVLVDNGIAEQVAEFRTDAQLRQAAQRQRSNVELRQIASLMETAIHAERDLSVYSINAPDMFGLLDSDLLRERFPLYPGHDRAMKEWETARETAKDNVYYKPFMTDAYSVDFRTGTFEEVASKMFELGLRPSELNGLLARITETN